MNLERVDHSMNCARETVFVFPRTTSFTAAALTFVIVSTTSMHAIPARAKAMVIFFGKIKALACYSFSSSLPNCLKSFLISSLCALTAV
jgi:hypothetical protein